VESRQEEEKQQSIERCTLVKQVLRNLAGGAAMNRSIAPRSSENQILSLDASIVKIKNRFMIPEFEMKREYEDVFGNIACCCHLCPLE